MYRCPAMRLSAMCCTVICATLGLGCRDGAVPPLRIPQLEEAREFRAYGAERSRAARACATSTATVESYVACMETAGWIFLPRSAAYPAEECWRLRDAGDARALPPAHCFHPATPAGAPAEEAERTAPRAD